jgi:hypothetical protein
MYGYAARKTFDQFNLRGEYTTLESARQMAIVKSEQYPNDQIVVYNDSQDLIYSFIGGQVQEQCPECLGAMEVWTQETDPWGEPYREPCPNCDGKGYVLFDPEDEYSVERLR